MEDRRYPIELEVITPLSVGAGNDNEWVKGLDFVQKEGKVYVIDMQKVAAAGVDVGALTALFLKSDDSGISQLLGNKISELSRYVFDLPAKTDNNIKAFQRTQFYDKPLVAGSSIKGSIRSALFNYLRTDEQKNEEVFGTMKDGTDFMRFIRIGDVEMPSTVLVNTKLFNLRKGGEEWLGGWKQLMNKTIGDYNPVGFNTLYECVAPGEKGLGNISLAVNAFNLLEKFGNVKSPYASKKRTLLHEPINCLFQVINDVTKAYLQKEQAFFQKYDAERSDEVLSCIESLLSMIPSDGSSCLMKMSAGVGFHSITGDWQYVDYDKTKLWTDGRHAGKKKYKSRKIAEYNHRLQLMGFVRLHALSQDEATKRKQDLQQRHEDRQTKILNTVKQREIDMQQKAAAEQARRQAIELEKQKTEEYNRLILQAKQDMNSELWDEAIANLEKAAVLYPEKTEVTQLKAECQNAKSIAEYRLQEQRNAEQKFSQPLSEVIKGKTSAGNLVGTTVKWLKAEGHSFGQEEQTAFIAEAKNLSAGEIRKLKSKLSDLAKVAGKECVEQLQKELEIG
jgi:tetratricopeptide (TPR) repeat protein